MLQTTLSDRKGFEVLHNSQPWRMAVHAYDDEVNGIASLKNWGRHLDSEEAFLLLGGKGWIITAEESGEYRIEELSKEIIRIVESGERHAILLTEDSAALIIENRDMSNSVTEPIPEEMIKKILEKTVENI